MLDTIKGFFTRLIAKPAQVPEVVTSFESKLASWQHAPVRKARRLHLSTAEDKREVAKHKKSKPVAHQGMYHPVFAGYRLVPRLHAWVREDEYHQAVEFVRLQAKYNRNTRKLPIIRSYSQVQLNWTAGTQFEPALRLINVIPDENYRITVSEEAPF